MPRPLPHHPRATLASIAAELGISRTTVSNAYNRPDQLSPGLRDRILETAHRRGYAGPDPMARSLRTRRTGAIGVVLPGPVAVALTDPPTAEFLGVFCDECHARGRAVLLIPGDPGPASHPEPVPAPADPAPASLDEPSSAITVASAAVDGVLVVGLGSDDPRLPALRERRLPTVVCDQPHGMADAALVGLDEAAAMATLARHVLDGGHRRLGIVTGRLARDRNDRIVDAERLGDARMDVPAARIAALVDAVRAAGILRRDVTIVERYDDTADAGRSAAEDVLSADPAVTAILCLSDALAVGVLAFARDAGYDVPGRLSVTGFGGGAPAALGLTTMTYAADEKGRRTAGLLFEPGRAVPPLPVRLVPGRTCGPVDTHER